LDEDSQETKKKTASDEDEYDLPATNKVKPKDVSKSALEFFTDMKNDNITMNTKMPQKSKSHKINDEQQINVVEVKESSRNEVNVSNEIDITENSDKNGDKMLVNSAEL
jgi:hypothetical protein